MTTRRAGLVLLLWFAVGCRRDLTQGSTVPVVAVPTLDSIAKAYVRLAVGLGEHDPDSIDYYVGPPEWVADIRKTAPGLGEIRSKSVELNEALKGMAVHDQMSETRKSFLHGQLAAVACRAGELAGGSERFDDEAMCSFGYTAPQTIDEKAMAAVRGKILGLVGGTGSPAERLGKYESKFVVPPAKVRAVMLRAIAGCRAQTRKHIDLPANEGVTLELAGQEPWAGYSLYKGGHQSVVTINMDFPLTVDRALDLACHEAYPGHHAYNMTQADLGLPELLVQPTYSPQSFLSESAAAMAVEVAFTPAERARFEREDLMPLAGLSASEADVAKFVEVAGLVEELQPAVAVIAREFVDGNLEFQRASDRLEREALMGSGFEMLKYFNEFRSYIVTYTCGPNVLKGLLAKGVDASAVDARWAGYGKWMKAETAELVH